MSVCWREGERDRFFLFHVGPTKTHKTDAYTVAIEPYFRLAVSEPFGALVHWRCPNRLNRPCQVLSTALQAFLLSCWPPILETIPQRRPVANNMLHSFPLQSRALTALSGGSLADATRRMNELGWRPSSMVVGLVTDFVGHRMFVVVLTCEQINQKSGIRTRGI